MKRNFYITAASVLPCKLQELRFFTYCWIIGTLCKFPKVILTALRAVSTGAWSYMFRDVKGATWLVRGGPASTHNQTATQASSLHHPIERAKSRGQRKARSRTQRSEGLEPREEEFIDFILEAGGSHSWLHIRSTWSFKDYYCLGPTPDNLIQLFFF